MLGSVIYYGLFFFFNDTATTEIYTLSLHDALPIWGRHQARPLHAPPARRRAGRDERDQVRAGPQQRDEPRQDGLLGDRKSTRLNSSHANISYAVFCLKKKNIERLESTRADLELVMR